jgi:curli production assembly/transport component CsgF
MAMVLKLLSQRIDYARLAQVQLAGFIIAFLFLIHTTSVPTKADELVYKPVNPSFGGNPFNGSYLLGNAAAQRGFNAPENKKPASEEFAEEIQRGLLSEISRNISDQILGENARDSGSFSVSGTNVTFHREGGQVVIDIQDQRTGGSTTIEMPVPSY